MNKVHRYVEPFVIYSQKMFIGGVNIPRFSNSIPNNDKHNIQTLMDDALGKLVNSFFLNWLFENT